MELTNAELESLRDAKRLLENPSLAARITSLVGTPLEKGFELLPEKWTDAVHEATNASLTKAFEFAILTLDQRTSRASSDGFHKILVAANGAIGGAFGLPGLIVELPISTTVMLRSIADIARSYGEDIKSVESKLSCIEVFALGGNSRSDDAAETGYFAVRTALARAVSEAATYIVERGIAERGAPVLVRLIGSIAGRFGAVVSEKVAAQAIPIIGAAGGAVINTIFIDHFQDMARGHFTVRKLERIYGTERIQAEYEKITN